MKIFKNHSLENQIRNEVNDTLPVLNEAIAAFNRLPLADITSIADVKLLYENLQLLLESKLEGESNVFGINISKAKALKILELDTSEVITLLEQIMFPRGCEAIFTVGTLKSNQIIADTKRLDNYIESKCFVELTNPKHIECYKEYEMLTKAFDTFCTKFNVDKRGLLSMRMQQFFDCDKNELNINQNQFYSISNHI
jgi:hypothetical protein